MKDYFHAALKLNWVCGTSLQKVKDDSVFYLHLENYVVIKIFCIAM